MARAIYNDLQDRLSQLQCKLYQFFPFFGNFIINTNLIPNPSIKTAATNGKTIWYSPDFFNSLTDQEILAVLIHEVFHCVYFHCDKKRKGNRYHKKWNCATDFAINLEIDELDKTKIKLPKNCLLDPKYKDMIAEEIYDLLPDGFGGYSLDELLDMPMDEDTKREIEDRIIAAYERAKLDRGNIPLGIERAVNDIRQSRVPWNRIFQRFMGNTLAKEDYSYAQPNRRFIGEDLYLPSLQNYKLGRIGLFPDMSGSIGENEAGAFGAELRKVSGMISEIVVGSWDTQVHTWTTVRDMSNLHKALMFKGGGGTDVNCVFEEIKKRKETFDLVIILTDGQFGTLPPRVSVRYPTIFVMTTDVIPEWGMVVKLKI